jgi:hypothetical protein
MPCTQFTLPVYLLAALGLHGQSAVVMNRYDASATGATGTKPH